MILSPRSLAVLLCVSVVFAPMEGAQPGSPPAAVQQPVDPLTTNESDTAASALRASPQFPEAGLFATIVLKEPAKSEVLAYTTGSPIARLAFAVILDRRHNRTFEAVVDVKAPRVVSWTEVKGVQPAVLDANTTCSSASSKATRGGGGDAARHRDFGKVQIANWSVGQVAAAFQQRRLLRALSYFKG